MSRQTNATYLKVGFLILANEKWLARNSTNWSTVDDFWEDDSTMYFVEEMQSIADEEIAILVPVAPGERHKKLPYRVSHILDKCEAVFEVPTCAGKIKANQSYQAVTSRNVYRVEKLLPEGVRISSMPPSEYGPEVVPWEKFCARVYKEPETF